MYRKEKRVDLLLEADNQEQVWMIILILFPSYLH